MTHVATDGAAMPCDVCQAPAFAFQPGTAPHTITLLGTEIVTDKGVPAAAWCVACHPNLKKQAAA